MGVWCSLVSHLLTRLALLSLGLAVVYPAPIGLGTQRNLNVTIQSDGHDSLHGQLLVSLAAYSHRLVNASALWPVFSRALHQTTNKSSSHFAVIGIHSHQRNVTFCERLGSGRYRPLLNGTNLGTVWKVADLEVVCLYNPHSTPLNVLLRLDLYDDLHPIPGGCNIEFALENSPFILVHRRPSAPSTDGGPLIDYIEFQPAALGNEGSPGRQCGQLSRARLNYELYAYYSRHTEDDEGEYLQAIDWMSNRKWLQRHATLIRRIGHHQRIDHHSHSSTSDSSFLRLFLITSLNQQIYFNIIAIDENAEATENDHRFNSPSPATRSSASASSLYVPSQIVSHVSLSNYAQLFISLSALSLFSLIVATIGYRHFILELFYFTFLLSLGLCLSIGSRFTAASSNSSSLPAISLWLLLCSVLSSLLVAALWTELCRQSRNLKCAFCGHSLTLSICTVAITGDVFISLPVTSTLLTDSHYLYYIAVLAILLCHGVFLLYLDYFSLSALASSFTSVYFLLLPIDLYLFSGILFRILFQLFLVLTQFSSNSSCLIVTFITFTARDVFLIVIFALLVSGSVYWQLITKLATKGYGFGCMVAPKANMSNSSIVANMKLQVQPTKVEDRQEMRENVKKVKKRRSPTKKKTSPKSLKCRKAKSGSPSQMKLYRCKNCQKLELREPESKNCCPKLRRCRPKL